MQGLSNVMGRTGQKVRLECVATGLPFPTMHWLHNNKIVKETRDIRVITMTLICLYFNITPVLFLIWLDIYRGQQIFIDNF